MLQEGEVDGKDCFPEEASCVWNEENEELLANWRKRSGSGAQSWSGRSLVCLSMGRPGKEGLADMAMGRQTKQVHPIGLGGSWAFISRPMGASEMLVEGACEPFTKLWKEKHHTLCSAEISSAFM